MTDCIEFTLNRILPTLNSMLRMHWSERRRHQRALAWEVLAAIHGHKPPSPICPAIVYVERCCRREPDTDNMISSVKNLLDVLCLPSRTHPNGLGLIVDDAPALCTLRCACRIIPAREGQSTRVVIGPRSRQAEVVVE